MSDPTSALPRSLVEAAEREGRTAWLGTVPATVARLAQAWSLSVAAPFQPGGQTAWVAPACTRATGTEMVLKVGWPHPEAAHEADGLRVWAGHGAVQVYSAEESDDCIALLLERCRPGTPLAARPELEQDEIIAALLPRLWVAPPAGHRFRSLQVMCDQWAREFEEQLAAAAPLDPGLAREGIALFQTLPATADRQVLLATDLHAGNVLAAEREPWLVIDPKPFVGDPTYDVLQHLLNCDERLRADPAGFSGKMADLLGLDAVRLRRWLFARCVQEAPNCPQLAHIARSIPID